MINITQNEDGNRKMWEMIKAENPNAGRLTMPVILVDGEISYSHKNLMEFVEGLKNK